MFDDDMASPGHIIGPWMIEEKINSGTYGQVYRARFGGHDEFTASKLYNQTVALKLERSLLNGKTKVGPHKREVMTLMELKRLTHEAGLEDEICCSYVNHGQAVNGLKYLAVTLKGQDLHTLRKATQSQTFSMSTSLRLGLQTLQRLETLHSLGYIHRDVKPANLALGCDADSLRNVYLLDMGMAKKFVADDGSHLPQREVWRQKKLFCGSRRYCSANLHHHQEPSRRDDIWSLAFSLVEMTEGRLPWRGDSPYADINKINFRCASKLPPHFNGIDEHLGSLGFEDSPDYELLRGMFLLAMERLDVCQTDPFDWEDGQEEKNESAGEDSGVVSTSLTNTCGSYLHPFSHVS